MLQRVWPLGLGKRRSKVLVFMDPDRFCRLKEGKVAPGCGVVVQAKLLAPGGEMEAVSLPACPHPCPHPPFHPHPRPHPCRQCPHTPHPLCPSAFPSGFSMGSTTRGRGRRERELSPARPGPHASPTAACHLPVKRITFQSESKAGTDALYLVKNARNLQPDWISQELGFPRRPNRVHGTRGQTLPPPGARDKAPAMGTRALPRDTKPPRDRRPLRTALLQGEEPPSSLLS